MIRILLTKKQLEKVGKKAFDDAEWLPYLSDYPNLRGVFSDRWGDVNDPATQLKNFINFFLTEQEVLLFGLLAQKNCLKKNKVEKRMLEIALETDDEAKTRIFLVYPFLKEENVDTITIFLTQKYKKLYATLFIEKTDAIPSVLLKLNPNDASMIYILGFVSPNDIIYTKEFVTFYLKHVKGLTRKDLFHLCQKMGRDWIQDQASDWYSTTLEEWEYFKTKWNQPRFEAFQADMFEERIPSLHQFILNKYLKKGMYLYFYINEILISYMEEFEEKNEKHRHRIILESFARMRLREFERLGGYQNTYLYYKKNLTQEDLTWIDKVYREMYSEDLAFSLFGKSSLFYAIPRGGLEVLSIFMYANDIAKYKAPAFTDIRLSFDEIFLILTKLQAKIEKDVDLWNEIENTKQEIEQLFQKEEVFSLNPYDTQYKALNHEQLEVNLFGDKFHHDEIDTLALIDDYFASGQNLWLMFKTIYPRFKNQVSPDDIFLFTITKRRNFGRKETPIGHAKRLKQALLSHDLLRPEIKSLTEIYLDVITKIYHGIQTEEICSMYLLFPKIKKILNGEATKIPFNTEPIKFNSLLRMSERDFFQAEFMTKEWIDNLTLTVVFPHSIADGKTEELLRMLYGERFKHGTRERVNFLRTLLLPHKS